MADGFIVRKGGVATEQALAPTITQVATTETSITFTITNNDAETAIIRHRLDDITDEGVIVELATNATSANITVSNLAEGTEFTVFATTNVTGKVKSNVTQLAISTNQIPAPTITLVSKTDTSVTFTLKNNSVETRDVTFGLTTPPTTTTISLASNATSGNQTFSNLDDDTTITIFAQAEGGLIGQLNVTTDEALNFTAATGGTTLEYNSGGKRFRSHTFTSNGNFVVSTVGDNVDDRNKVDYLIVAGGASGGRGWSGSVVPTGGGGAGGYRTTNGTSGADTSARDKVTVTATTFSIVVGAGGAGTSTTNPQAGATSSGFGVTTVGGGTGAHDIGRDPNQFQGGPGGSGGGSLGTGIGLGTANEGTDGGIGTGSGSTRKAGGGGGAGTAGDTPQGGNGLANILRNGTSETRAGGGSGGSSSNTTGGTGGGGTGGPNATNASANTGSGGGGAWGSGDTTYGNGGSGLVVIRYEIAPSV